jgi:hypothetical protein
MLEFNLFENNFDDEFKENELEFQSSFPLFNFNVLKNVEYQDAPLNLLGSRQVSEIIGDILQKKIKGEGTALVVPKKRGRKAVPKDGKAWDDPTITMREIIENDLAGVPMESEIKMKAEKLRKMREKKAEKRAERLKGTTVEVPAIENAVNAANTLALSIQPLFNQTELALAPQIIFKDGKIVVDNSNFAPREQKKLVIAEKKHYKVTSMSFRTKNQTAKWTEEETRKFYKALEIFGADFSMIAKLFPTRNRDQVKNKFHKEEKVNAFLMDEAFRKNKLLSKRSIMDRIRAFSNNFTNGGNELEGLGVTQLERTLSNTSIDSMEGKIMDEIQEIFLKEIRPQNTFVGSLALSMTPAKEENVVETQVVVQKEETKNENERQNLLLKLLN